MASAGIGTSSHLAGELFKVMTGVDMVHVPFRGAGPALNDLLGGQVQVQFTGTTGSAQYVETGKLRALAVTTAWRYDAWPGIPTVGIRSAYRCASSPISSGTTSRNSRHFFAA
jgi:tripartite-type tricarboxylate transporter receptor subunit TctC